MSDYIDRDLLLAEIEELKKSPWYNDCGENYERIVRSDAIGTVVDLCVSQLPSLMCKRLNTANGLRVVITIFLAYVHVAERKRNIQAPLKKHLTMIGKKTYALQGTKK